ncbi:MAG: c-type cytochrome [Planctomycetes bacterium]|nr:c-type cytochrome [Planctomycetota bacterium]
MSPALLFVLASLPAAAPPAPDISVPPGFVAAVVADNAIAPDIYTMTIDDDGRVLVAGRGYVRVLVDDNADGIADRAIDLIDGLKDGPMGLFAEGDSLYVVTNGGLQRYRGYNGKDKLTQPPETLVKLKTVGEHDAHAVRRGPDGWLYFLCGNQAGVTKDTITSSRSPVKNPVAGTLLRFSPDRPTLWSFQFPREIEVVADGFRNAYSFDFNLDGEPFTYDSDNERCVGLPWYEGCRFYHVVPGGNYGWRSPQLGQFWRKPPYFVDCVPPVCDLGRGSPTGVAAYRHTHFPAQYRGGFFLADWTFGRIHFVPLWTKDSTYGGEPQIFAEAIGTSGFAPTGLAVHPKTGELFVSIGGRGTRGGVYRISHEKSPAGKPLPMAKRSLEWTAADTKRWLADCTGADVRLRRNTLELLARTDLTVMPWSPKFQDAVKPNLSHPDPLVRIAAARLVKPLVVPLGSDFDTQAKLTIALQEVNDDPAQSRAIALDVLRAKGTSDNQKLQALRIIQLSFGDLTAKGAVGTVFEGYTFRGQATEQQRKEIDAACYSVRAAVGSELEREILRMYGCLGLKERLTQITDQLAPNSTVRDDLSTLAILARAEPDDWNTKRIAEALLVLDEKAVKQKITRDTFWPLRLTEILTDLGEHYPKLAETVLDHADFGRSEHILLVKPLKIDARDALDRFMVAASKDPNFQWTAGHVALFASQRPTFCRLNLLALKLWDRPELRDAILRVLHPQQGDQAKFAVGLESLDPEVVRISAAALAALPSRDGVADLVAAAKALRRLSPEDKTARAAVVSVLNKRVPGSFGDNANGWTESLRKNFPDAAKLLDTNDGFDATAWKTRVAEIAWDKGDTARGKLVFAKANCAACHDGGRAFGPSLLGISKRFGRDDLLTSILQPSKDVSPRYRPVRVTTNDEKVYIGMLIYEATDGVILQTNADTSVRIAGAEIASKRPVESSIMPAGLLDKLTDVEVADLFAYLKSLEEVK